MGIAARGSVGPLLVGVAISLVAAVLLWTTSVIPARAAVVITTPANATVNLTTNGTNGTRAFTSLASLVLTEGSAGEFTAASTLVLAAPSGWQFNVSLTPTCVGTSTLTCTGAVASDSTKITVTIGVASGAAATLTLSNVQVRPISNSSASGAITRDASSTLATTAIAAGATLGTITAANAMTAETAYTLTLRVVSSTADCGPGFNSTVPTGQGVTAIDSPTLPADGSITRAVCALLRDGNGNAVSGVTVNFTTTVGYLSTSTTRIYATATNNGGNASVEYRGAGFAAASDLVLAQAPAVSRTDAITVTLSASSSVSSPTGASIARIEFKQPISGAIAPNLVSSYVSPTTATNISVRAVDFNGQGVRAALVQLSTDRGRLIANRLFTAVTHAQLVTLCGSSSSQTIIESTTDTDLDAPNGTATTGTINFTLCARDSDTPGLATIVGTAISNPGAKQDTGVLISRAPNEINANLKDDGTLTATVRDGSRNLVADGTPVRFVLPQTIGALSTSCGVTKDGVVTTRVAVDAPATLLISTDWNETGTAPTCFTSAGSKVLTISSPVTPIKVAPAATATPRPGATATPAPATASYNTIPLEGGFGLVVFSGGTVADLVKATKCPEATMALYATLAGFFITYVPGTKIEVVNRDFLGLYPGGRIPANTPFIGRCK